jgi:hypothetical protein
VGVEHKWGSHEVELERFVGTIILEDREMKFGSFLVPCLGRYTCLQDPEMTVGSLVDRGPGEGNFEAELGETGSLGHQKFGTEDRVEGAALVLAAERVNYLLEFLDPESHWH